MHQTAAFHPIVRQWWSEHIANDPTPAQRAGWSSIRAGRDTLIAAPTGSGKTLAAFLHAIDELFREGLERGALPDEVRVIYVSPLKALSTDIHRNLAAPRREIRALAEQHGLPPVRISAATRSGDTSQAERAAMLRKPPHILVTTPESLYLLLTAERSREMLRTARTVIVDEIHAIIETRRGAHLSLSLERLDHVAGRRLQRIGLSATQRPIAHVAEFLSGSGERAHIVDEGHVRALDLALQLTPSPVEAVMSKEVWNEVYDRLTQLIEEHRTTLVFVNTRKLAERAAAELTQRLGEDAVTAHHGSLSKEMRLDAEERLKTGKLKALVATASLELGIDIGHVDLVCQIGSPHRIATLLQRVGRSGHTVHGTPKGRLFPTSRDDLVECTALLRAVRAGELDRIIIPPEPIDVLGQQMVAECAAEEWREDDLYALVTRAYPYRTLGRATFDEVVHMLARGISTHRGRRGAMLHHDAVHARLQGRKGARMLAITSGGAIPDVADYRVVLEPEGTFVGTLNEDFAVESMAGDVFQLGNMSWRVLKVETGVVRVADAQGIPPSIPFWLGEAPARSNELSQYVSQLRSDIDTRLDDNVVQWLTEDTGIPDIAAQQIVTYFAETKRLLGAIPTQQQLVLERFFDEGGGMQLVLHAPFGARVNRAWGLALRKKFCQNFNFELQAAATDEGLLLSLGPSHSFPLDEVFRYLNPATVRETLVQAMLDSPIFLTRWRWVAMLALTVPRSRNGRRTPPQIQRMIAEDLLSSVFPDATACLEHVVGEREIPDHPLVTQTIRDCLEEAMDLPMLEAILQSVLAGDFQLVARDTTEPSPLASEIVNARVYQFLDGAPLEERRTHAVYTRRATEPSSSNDLAALDVSAIERVRDEAFPTADTLDELHDALLTAGFLREAEARAPGAAHWPELFTQLVQHGRAARVHVRGGELWISAERLPELRAILSAAARVEPDIAVPRGIRSDWTAEDAFVELLRSRMDVMAVQSAAEIASWFDTPHSVEQALLALENEGRILRGWFTPGSRVLEWCDRRLLARVHRYTLDRLRAEIQPVHAQDFMRFLFRWQRVEPAVRAEGMDGLAAVLDQLAGFEAAAAAWEADILPARMARYDPTLIDMLSLAGRLVWGRVSRSAAASAPIRATPMVLAPRESFHLWHASNTVDALGVAATKVHALLAERGALFFHEIVSASGLPSAHVEDALGELVGAGLASADSFAGLRALLVPEHRRVAAQRSVAVPGVANAGRWSLLRVPAAAGNDVVEHRARSLLRRYGVVFRRLLAREACAPSWRDLVLVYRRMEARGELRGGRFVAGMSGEQFALPEAVGLLRSVRKEAHTGALHSVSACDPLNLVGIVTPEAERISAVRRNRVIYRDGVAVAVLEAGRVRLLAGHTADDDALIGRIGEARVPFGGAHSWRVAAKV
jgi:ATP-dependent Lhr-like helicase